MSMPLISMITISFNSEKTIEKTILSVINQKKTNYRLEYIIVDGLSTDRTMDIVNKYSSNIDIILSESDKGISDAFNKGISCSKGDIIGIINSDDTLLPDSLEKIAEYYDKDLDVIYGWGYRLNRDGTLTNYHINPELNKLKYEMFLFHPGVFVSRKAYEKYGFFDTSLKCVMDRELLLRMYVGGAKFKYIDIPIAVYFGAGLSFKRFFSDVLSENRYITLKYGGNKIQADVCFIKDFIKFKVIFALKRILKKI